MLYPVFFIGILLILFIGFAFTKARLLLEYGFDGKSGKLVLTFILLRGLVKYRYIVTDREKKGEGEKRAEMADVYVRFKQSYRQFYETGKSIKDYLEKKLLVEDLRIDMTLGTGDACHTGILSGMAWAATGILVSFVSNTFETGKLHCNIKPDFSKPVFKVDFDCIFSLKVVHIIVVSVKFLFHYIKNRRKHKRMIGGDISG